MPIDVKQFATELGLSADDQATLMGLFEKNPSAAGKIDGMLTAQVQTALQPLQADLAQKSKSLDDQFAMLDNLRGTDSATLDAANKRVEQAATAVTLAQERIRRMARDFGVDADPWLKDIGAPVTTTTGTTTPSTTTTTLDTPMDLQKVMQTVGQQDWTVFRSMAQLNDLSHEHVKLFGQPLPQQSLLDTLQDRVKRTGNGNLTLRDVWQEVYKVPEKLKEQQETEIKRRETEAYERGKREAADAAALGTVANQAPPAFVQSPVLAQLTKDQPTHISGVPEGVVAAIADYRQRRLNQKTA